MKMEVKTNEAKRPAAALNLLKFRAAIYNNMDSEDIGFSNYSYWKSTLRTFLRIRLLLR